MQEEKENEIQETLTLQLQLRNNSSIPILTFETSDLLAEIEKKPLGT